jgi:hypothetical protein
MTTTVRESTGFALSFHPCVLCIAIVALSVACERATEHPQSDASPTTAVAPEPSVPPESAALVFSEAFFDQRDRLDR